jgi:predicted small lipoprotein YifL
MSKYAVVALLLTLAACGSKGPTPAADTTAAAAPAPAPAAADTTAKMAGDTAKKP